MIVSFVVGCIFSGLLCSSLGRVASLVVVVQLVLDLICCCCCLRSCGDCGSAAGREKSIHLVSLLPKMIFIFGNPVVFARSAVVLSQNWSAASGVARHSLDFVGNEIRRSWFPNDIDMDMDIGGAVSTIEKISGIELS